MILNNLHKFSKSGINVSRIKSIILDFSGTTVDPYVIAPAITFVEVLKNMEFQLIWNKHEHPWDFVKIFI